MAQNASTEHQDDGRHRHSSNFGQCSPRTVKILFKLQTGYTQGEIARVEKVSREWVSQLKQKLDSGFWKRS